MFEKDAEWMWQSTQETAMKEIQTAMMKNTELTFHDRTKTTFLQCDVSEYTLGATLPLDDAPVDFAMHTISGTVQNFTHI